MGAKSGHGIQQPAHGNDEKAGRDDGVKADGQVEKFESRLPTRRTVIWETA